MTKKGKGIKTGGKMKAAPPAKLIVSATCQFCHHRAELQISSPQREGSTFSCYEHIAGFFAIWTGGATEFTVVKL